MIIRTARRAYGSAKALSGVARERQVPWLPLSTLHRRRDRRLHAMLRYAAENVPYYRELFRQQRVDPRTIAGAEELARLPLLEKSAVRLDPERFRSTSRLGRQAVEFVTSGTTGTPSRIYHDLPSLLANPAHCEPEKEVEREILGRRRAKRLTIIYGGSTIRKIWQVYRQHTLLPSPSAQSLLSVDTPLGEVIDHINQYRPEVVSGYGSYLEALFRYVAAQGIQLHRPHLVSYGADAISEPGRHLIQKEFGIPISSRYGAVESFRIGFTCPEGHGFHVRDDLCHVRIVDREGRTLPPGQSGEVVISNLVNRGSVLLNYRLGDVATFSPFPCPCGRSLPLLTGLEGRAEDIVYLSGGRFVHPRSVWACLKGQRGLLRYQLRQQDPVRFELWLEVVRPQDFERIVRQTDAELRILLGGSAVDYRRVNHIPTAPGGKFRPVIALGRQPEVTV